MGGWGSGGVLSGMERSLLYFKLCFFRVWSGSLVVDEESMWICWGQYQGCMVFDLFISRLCLQ